jgi:hypothetical protein
MRQGWVSGLIFALALSGGCSVLVDVDGKQCQADADCTSKNIGDACVHNVCVSRSSPDAGAVDGPGSSGCSLDAQCKTAAAPRCMRGECVPSAVAERFVCSAEEVNETYANVRYSFQVLEFVTRKAPEGLVVLACRGNDVLCADPSARFEDKAGTGLVELDLPYGFLGYFDVKSKVTMPALSYLTKPLTADTHDRDLQVASTSTVQALASVAGVEFDETKGIAMLEAFDCGKTPAGGVHFTESKGAATAFYLVNHVPNSEVTLSVYDEVNNVADGGFINVQPGFVTFSARYGVDGPLLGEFNAAVRASTVTYIDMYF